MNKPDGGQAFPRSAAEIGCEMGMTLRDYFAAAALQGYLASGNIGGFHAPHGQAQKAYAWADAMLAERDK